MSAPLTRQNNFDLIRLLAAMQVVVAHAIGHTELIHKISPWARQCFDLLLLIPGVPIFFVISGFLITGSYERNPSDLRGYFWRRGLRIFPALWVCLAFTLVVLGYFGFLERAYVTSPIFWSWLAGQLSFFQFYNPEQFRSFGIGVANGALWTITVELQFYLFVPLFWRFCADRLSSKILLTALFLISFALYGLMDYKLTGANGFTGAPIVFKLLFVTLLPHVWMFLLGILIQRNYRQLGPWLEGKFLYYALTYLGFLAVIHVWLPERSPAFYIAQLPARTLLALATIAGAYSFRSLSHRLLRGNDFSYGIYIYHSLVINILVQLGMMNSLAAVGWVYVIALILAGLSWKLIERPALAHKDFWGRS
jgi:peptidoglycan/LPS O-acetylase OafA/YrhL